MALLTVVAMLGCAELLTTTGGTIIASPSCRACLHPDAASSSWDNLSRWCVLLVLWLAAFLRWCLMQCSEALAVVKCIGYS